MKRLVCFFDGTWDSPNDKNVTNVVKLQRAILKTDQAGIEQLTHYEVGIATEYSGHLRFWAGVFAVGLGSRVRDAYRFLCEHVEEGDEIYLFGFSRGAFEARTLAEQISLLGILPRSALNLLPLAWKNYRRYRANPEHQGLLRFRERARFPFRVKCVGVWDTVGTLGLRLVRRHSGAHISELPTVVDVGLHALAIDEPRGPYSPILWTSNRGGVPFQGQIIEQAWFPGSHDDVGGGGECHALSDAALLWMAERVGKSTGLALDYDGLSATVAPDPLGEQCSPTTGLYRVSALLPYVRLIKQDLKALHPLRRFVLRGWRTCLLPADHVPVNETVHDSAITRFGKCVPVRRGDQVSKRTYHPRSLRDVHQLPELLPVKMSHF